MQPSPVRVIPGHDPEKKARRLKRRFGRITARFERAQKRRKFARDWSGFLVASIIAAIVTFIVTAVALKLSPWPPSETVRHIGSFWNCDSARTFDLAPAKRGEPGYYERHDADNDGIACEPWSGRRHAPVGRTTNPFN